jgi:predicted ribosomally synthesized peptide with nif11-like leader
MSVEDAKKFVDLAGSDPEIQKKFREGFHKVQNLAKEKGLNVSREDLQQHLRDRWGVTKPASFDDKDTCTICVS